MPLVPTNVTDPPNCIRVTCLISQFNEQKTNTIHLNNSLLLFLVCFTCGEFGSDQIFVCPVYFVSELRNCVHRIIRTGLLIGSQHTIVHRCEDSITLILHRY